MTQAVWPYVAELDAPTPDEGGLALSALHEDDWLENNPQEMGYETDHHRNVFLPNLSNAEK